MMRPKHIEIFAEELVRQLPGILVSYDEPAGEDGTWWIDIDHRPGRQTLSWSRQRGFGFYLGDDVGFGERPSACHADPVLAARIVRQTLDPDSTGQSFDRVEQTVLTSVAQGQSD